MRSFVDITDIQNNTVSDIGPARLAVRWLDAGPPPSAGIIVAPYDGQEQEYELSLGQTFPVGSETWRFDDVSFDSADRWHVTVIRVDPDSPPWQPPPLTGKRVWLPIHLRPYGRLDEGQMQALEATLGRGLPVTYRQWLAENNGAQPVGDHCVPGLPFTLFEQRPLLGVHPQYPPFDLVHAEQQHRRRWLSDEYVVIAEPSGGLLAVKRNHPGYDSINFLPEAAMLGSGGPDTAAAMESRLMPIADDFYRFLGRLQPMTTPDGEAFPVTSPDSPAAQ